MFVEWTGGAAKIISSTYRLIDKNWQYY